MLRGRRGARLTALTSGGTIPDTARLQVLLEPENQTIGTVNEDFAVESLAGDVFQLGNTTYRILRVERGAVRVEDAQGPAAQHPLLARRGAGPQRRAVGLGVAAARRTSLARLRADPSGRALKRWLDPRDRHRRRAAARTAGRLSRRRALRRWAACRRRQRIVIERFFDESGGMQLVIHSPFGSRINRAWGLALRKRFCRKFNFELQAAATEDAIVLSLSTSHSFELDEVARYLHSNTVRDVLVQALLDAPMFAVRWRWNAGIALALPRFRGGRKVAPQLQRMKAEDLLAAVFPDQIACAENIAGEREIPDHPLADQTIDDCLHEAMDIEGLERLLRAHRIRRDRGRLRATCRSLRRWRSRCSPRGPMPISTTRRSRSAARRR